MWKVETTASFNKDFRKLDKSVQKKIIIYLESLEKLNNPLLRAKPLLKNLKGLYRYRINDYRVIVKPENKKLILIALAVGHRNQIYFDTK